MLMTERMITAIITAQIIITNKGRRNSNVNIIKINIIIIIIIVTKRARQRKIIIVILEKLLFM